ncbi:type II toxin-antitoxin system RelE/ParE family toxin [Indioceanicola profundi]|uniref:type II toxin-antitoxin system RelE/ParE family toxin n=1 Tax=Indioceanicola profundi TaxID=2220096 RepID=UPI000E6ADE75|nr:type II toxin-antitoxin system RelE/ParE family toxin [Indioceanicola profundi]
MLPIIWSPAARRKLDQIIGFILERNPTAAEELLERLETSVLPASSYPYIFRAGRVPGTREIVAHPNYIVVYAVRADHIEIVTVHHARERYP